MMKPLPILAFAAMIALSSCRQQRYIYAASKINTPILKHKGDSRLNASFSFGNARGRGDSSRNLGYDVQAAYAITNHVAVMASTYHRRESDLIGPEFLINYSYFSNSYVKYNRNLVELGGGYFTNTGGETVFSVYGGTAFGTLSIRDISNRDSVMYFNNYNARLNKYFIQPGFSLIDDDVKVDLSARFTMLRYHNTGTTYTANDLERFILNDGTKTTTNFYIEPSLNLLISIPSAKWLCIETGGSVVFNYSNTPIRFWNLSVGVTINPVAAFSKSTKPAKKSLTTE